MKIKEILHFSLRFLSTSETWLLKTQNSVHIHPTTGIHTHTGVRRTLVDWCNQICVVVRRLHAPPPILLLLLLFLLLLLHLPCSLPIPPPLRPILFLRLFRLLLPHPHFHILLISPPPFTAPPPPALRGLYLLQEAR